MPEEENTRLLYCRKKQKITASQQRQHHNLSAVETIISVKIFSKYQKRYFMVCR